MQSSIERLSNLSDSDLLSLSKALAGFCPDDLHCCDCPLHDFRPINIEPAAPSCLSLGCDYEYFKRHKSLPEVL